MAQALTALNDNVEANRFSQLETWEFDQRHTLFSELEALRRLSVLMSELDEYLAQLPAHAAR